MYGFLVGAFSNAFLSKGLKRLIRQDRPLHKTTQLAHDEGARTAATHLVEAATSAVVATAVDTAIFAADEIGIKHPSPTPILHALPVPMEKELGHGMPSSHAMSLCFFATYIALACQTIYLVSHPNGVSSIHPFISLLRNLLPSCLKSSWDYGYGRYIFMTIMFVLVILECASRVRRRYHTWAQIIVGSILGSIVGYIHSTYAMPILREVSRDIPPLAERSNTFIITFSLGMTLLGALTLGTERHRCTTSSANRYQIDQRTPTRHSTLAPPSLQAVPSGLLTTITILFLLLLHVSFFVCVCVFRAQYPACCKATHTIHLATTSTHEGQLISVQDCITTTRHNETAVYRSYTSYSTQLSSASCSRSLYRRMADAWLSHVGCAVRRKKPFLDKEAEEDP